MRSHILVWSVELYHGLVRVAGLFAQLEPLQSQPYEPGGVEALGVSLAWVSVSFASRTFLSLAFEEYSWLCR